MDTVKDPRVSKRLKIRIAIGIIVLLGLIVFSLFRLASNVDEPVRYANDADHFKYGSISSDSKNQGLPYWIWATMPEVCKGNLPGGYASLGVIQEPGKMTPIGFSMRKVGFLNQVGPNCALCHSTGVRETAQSLPVTYLGAPAQGLNLMGYFQFLFDCARNPAFTPKNVVAAIERQKPLSFFERQIYARIAVPQVKAVLLEQAGKFDSIIANRPPWGPGRVDTFNPYKVLVFNQDMSKDTSIGTADFMSIWDQASREGMWLHWDGNNDSLDERNLSASIGAGATPLSLSKELNMAGVERVKQWTINLPAPRYPFAINYAQAQAGEPVYKANCAQCHDEGYAGYGAVIPTRYLQTDPERQAAFDKTMAGKMNTIGKGQPWAFNRFRTTEGYASHPLDGIWLRAPYLHNGSVPTMDELLSPPAQRRATFYAGNDVYDQARLGFVSDVRQRGSRQYYAYNTRDRGNGNGGHLYGVNLSPSAKAALIEYLKTK